MSKGDESIYSQINSLVEKIKKLAKMIMPFSEWPLQQTNKFGIQFSFFSVSTPYFIYPYPIP